MDRMSVSLAALVAAWLATASARAQDTPPVMDQWSPIIAEAAARFGVPAQWIRDVMAVESGGRTEFEGRPITSPKGAMGLMQVMPETYAEMRRAHDLGADPYAPRDNIFAGAAYLKAMHDRYGWPGLFAAYNAGPARYDDYLRTGRALPTETISYLTALDTGAPAADFSIKTSPQATNSRAPSAAEFASGRSIFFVRNGVRIAPDSSPRAASIDRRAAPIFVPLRGQRP